MAEIEEAPEKPDPRVIHFESKEDMAAFDQSLMKLMGVRQDQARANFVREYNILRMNHGGSWRHSARTEKPDTAMHHIASEMTIHFKGIADSDSDLIGRSLIPVNEDMQRQFSQNMYAVVRAAADKVGSVVNAKEVGSFAQSILEMFRKMNSALTATVRSACRSFTSIPRLTSGWRPRCSPYRPTYGPRSTR